MHNIRGKVVAITGASAGIGKAIALKLAENGVKVVLGARNTEQLQKIVEEINAAQGNAVFVKTDVSNKADLMQLVNTAVSHYGKLDVHNSGSPLIDTYCRHISRTAISGFQSFLLRINKRTAIRLQLQVGFRPALKSA